MASPMLDVDHNTICKYDSKIGGFMQVADKLRYLRGILLDENDDIAGPGSNV